MGEQDRPAPDARVVPVFKTDEPGLLPLAEIALQQEGIDYAVQRPGLAESLVGRRQATGSTAIDMPHIILVRAEDEAKARALLAELGQASGRPAPPADPPSAPSRPEPPAARKNVELFDDDTDAPAGNITDAQLQWLADQLEEESEDDDDYYIDAATLEMLEDHGGDPELLATLRRALGTKDGLTIRWVRT